MRSGSPIQHSAPTASISARRASLRVTARTACPSAVSSRASARPRHPPPTSRTRTPSALELRPQLVEAQLALATLAPPRVGGVEHLGDLHLGHVVVAALHRLLEVLLHLRVQALLGQLRGSARPPALVGRLEHLVEVVDLVLDLLLGRPSGAPVELRGAG